jgi:hypothetical protein
MGGDAHPELIGHVRPRVPAPKVADGLGGHSVFLSNLKKLGFGFIDFSWNKTARLSGECVCVGVSG